MPAHVRYFSVVFLLAIVIGVISSCKPANQPTASPSEEKSPPWFVDVTKEVGLDFQHDPGPTDGSYFMPQICGSGGAFIDLEGDGRFGIYLVHNAGPKSASKNKLFRQQPDGTYKDISAGSGLDIAGYFMGVNVGDVNNDGLPDIFVTEYGGRGGRLFLNKGKGRFEEVVKSGIDNPLWSTAASYLDYDADGWLDLVVVNYVDLAWGGVACNNVHGIQDYCAPSNYKGTITRLYKNRGCDDKGNWLGFKEVTEAAGLMTAPGPGLGVLCADFNGDGWPDIFVANDGKANHLWINQKNGKFKEEAVRRGIAFNGRGEAQANMGIAFGDVDGDGLDDVFVTHISMEYHSLWKQGPPGLFNDVADQAGLTKPHWRGTGWGTVLADFNHDGNLHLAIVNGKVARTVQVADPYWPAYADRNQLFINDGTGKFRDISLDNPDFCETPNTARGLAVADVNGDGALDLLVMQIGGKAKLFRNVAPHRGHWLMVRAFDPKLRRDVIGAEVRIQAGERKMQRLVQPSLSYLCSNDPRVHFGLGAVNSIEFIDVLWPGGVTERFGCGAADRVITVERGRGLIVSTKGVKAP